jgi:hypothetical protein
MQLFRNILCISLLFAPCILLADAATRYKSSMTSAMPLPGLTDSDSAIYMKGNKGVSVSGGQTTIADYSSKMPESMPQMGALNVDSALPPG